MKGKLSPLATSSSFIEVVIRVVKILSGNGTSGLIFPFCIFLFPIMIFLEILLCFDKFTL